LVGEAPGRTEQEKGFPFIGRSGRLLDYLLQQIVDIQKDIYITNLVKDRPIDYVTGKDRKPFYDEIIVCAPYLMKELKILKPALVVTLGRTSGDWFSNYGDYEINKYYPERKWLPLYHPSYLGRNRSEIPKFFEILKNTLEEIKCITKE
jgi:DNA polymerase